jgi:hypothetical protein
MGSDPVSQSAHAEFDIYAGQNRYLRTLNSIIAQIGGLRGEFFALVDSVRKRDMGSDPVSQLTGVEPGCVYPIDQRGQSLLVRTLLAQKVAEPSAAVLG